MGWKGNTSTPGRIFGNVVDTIIRQAMCDVILVKFAENFQSIHQVKRWLVPMSGGPNAPLAVKLLPALIKSSTEVENREICLTQIYKPFVNNPDTTVLETAISELIRYPNLEKSVIYQCLQADSVVEEIINLVKSDNYEMVILGASCAGLLQQAIQGNIPEAIASSVDSTVILVRGKIADKLLMM